MEVPEDLGRKLRRLLHSLALWKKRVAAKQGQILYLRVKARDLQTSRDYWKRRALAAESPLPTPSLEPASSLLPEESVLGEC